MFVCVECIILAQDEEICQAVVNTVMYLEFYKMQEISWLAVELLASQERLRCS